MHVTITFIKKNPLRVKKQHFSMSNETKKKRYCVRDEGWHIKQSPMNQHTHLTRTLYASIYACYT